MASELREYLKELYPEANDDLIGYYLFVISNHDEEKLPPTKEMRELAELDKQYKNLEKKINKLKETILEQRKRLKCKFQLVNVSHITGKKFDPVRFYSWVSTLVDEKTLEDLTIKTIDEKKFIQLESKGKISYDRMPGDCYSKTEQWRIAVSKAKLDDILDEI